jgi:hypothetical protein
MLQKEVIQVYVDLLDAEYNMSAAWKHSMHSIVALMFGGLAAWKYLAQPVLQYVYANPPVVLGKLAPFAAQEPQIVLALLAFSMSYLVYSVFQLVFGKILRSHADIRRARVKLACLHKWLLAYSRHR